jgi:hypothetical protein
MEKKHEQTGSFEKSGQENKNLDLSREQLDAKYRVEKETKSRATHPEKNIISTINSAHEQISVENNTNLEKSVEFLEDSFFGEKMERINSEEDLISLMKEPNFTNISSEAKKKFKDKAQQIGSKLTASLITTASVAGLGAAIIAEVGWVSTIGITATDTLVIDSLLFSAAFGVVAIYFAARPIYRRIKALHEKLKENGLVSNDEPFVVEVR